MESWWTEKWERRALTISLRGWVEDSTELSFDYRSCL
jgi:hypothetical protein